MHMTNEPTPALVSVTIDADGRVHLGCRVPKLEAVKLLLGIVEELRVQAIKEESRLIQVAPAPLSATV